MNPSKPWQPVSSIPAGEKLGPIYVSEECPGCGHPSVLGEIALFPLVGHAEYTQSCPTPRYYRRESGIAVRDDYAEGGGSSVRSVETFEGEANYSANHAPADEECIKISYTADATLTSDTYIDGVLDNTTVQPWEWSSAASRVNSQVPPEERQDIVWQICGASRTSEFSSSGSSSTRLITGADTLSEEDTFADAAARAASAEGNDFCWSWNPFLYPLAHPNLGSPWDARRCTGHCPDQPGFQGHGTFYRSGVFRGQGGGDGDGNGRGCLRYHWALVGHDEGPAPAAAAAKYRIIVPYDAALPDTQLDVSWNIVRRKNKGRIHEQAESAEEVTSVEIWRKTVQVGAPAEGGEFEEGAGEMDAPEDFLGSLHGNDDSWDDVGFQVVEDALQVSGRKEAEGAASMAMYKFVVHEYVAVGVARWDVEYLDEQDEVIQTDPQTAAIIEGETDIQLLATDPVEGAVAARVSSIEVTIPGDDGPVEVERGIGVPGQWMLQAKIRTGKWGFAELSGDGTDLFPMRITTYEHEIDGGSGHCWNGALEDSEPVRGVCGQCQALQIHETEETVEALVNGEFQTVRTIDESTDGERTMRWGREVYGPNGQGNPVTGNITGRPDWYWPLGEFDPADPESPPDPYVFDSQETPTKNIYTDTLTNEDIRRCGALIATEPDPAGEILGVEKRTATTVNAEDSTSIMRPISTVQNISDAPDVCIDYGSPTIDDGLVASVPNQAARLALKAWDGKEEWESDCPNGISVGSKIHQLSDGTFWEVISTPPEPCGELTEEHWKQLRYKSTPEQFMHTAQGGCTYFLENIVAKKCQ